METKTSKSSKKWDINLATSALLVIDMQNDFVREGAIMEVPHARTQVGRIADLIACFRAAKAPIFYTVHITDTELNPREIDSFPHLVDGGMRAGTEGVKVIDELAPAAEDFVIEKRRYSGFYGTDLELALHSLSSSRNRDSKPAIDTLIICGTVSNICCEATSRDAYYRDYKVIFGSDVNSAISKAAHGGTIANMELFGQVMTAGEIISELNQSNPLQS